MDDFMTVSVTLARERPLADGTTMLNGAVSYHIAGEHAQRLTDIVCA